MMKAVHGVLPLTPPLPLQAAMIAAVVEDAEEEVGVVQVDVLLTEVAAAILLAIGVFFLMFWFQETFWTEERPFVIVNIAFLFMESVQV